MDRFQISTWDRPCEMDKKMKSTLAFRMVTKGWRKGLQGPLQGVIWGPLQGSTPSFDAKCLESTAGLLFGVVRRRLPGWRKPHLTKRVNAAYNTYLGRGAELPYHNFGAQVCTT